MTAETSEEGAAAPTTAPEPTPAPAPRELRKPTWLKVSDITPASTGLNLVVKIVSVDVKVNRVDNSGKKTVFADIVAGDASGIVTLTVRNEQLEVCEVGKTVVLRNARVVMRSAHIRVEVNKWGKLHLATDESTDFEANTALDMSAVEYELVGSYQ